MNFLPIVQRELRVVSRKTWMYWVRSIFALVGAIAVLAMFYEYEGSRRVAPGSPMLWILSVVTMGLALFCGGLLTADCISSEKRDDTLGLLFLTNLRGYDVVAGKISIHAVTTASGLAAVLPVFFLPILAGGVTFAETVRVALAITVSFLFALTLGVWISARSNDARNAVTVTITAILLMVFLPLLWMILLEEMFRVRPTFVGVAQLSPGMLLYYARDSWYVASKGSGAYWISIGMFVVASAVFAALASRRLPRVWRQEETAPGQETLGKTRLWLRPGVFHEPSARRRVVFTSANPFFELLRIRFREFTWGNRFQHWITLFFAVMLIASFSRGNDEEFVIAMMIVFAMHAMAKLTFALDATRVFNEDKRSSALELLLVTSLGERAICEGQAAAFKLQSKRRMRRLFAFTVALQLTMILNGELHMRGDEFLLVGSFIWGPMIWTWSDYHTIPWLGMFHALKQNTHLKAALRTLAGVTLLPWCPCFLVLFFMAENNMDEGAAGVVTFAWAICSATFQHMKTTARRTRILHDFRVLVAGS